MGGIGFQQLCIFFFLFLAIRLHRGVLALPTSPERRNAILLLYVNYAAVLLITVRIIFRLIEYSAGIESAIPRQEAYQYVFDSSVRQTSSASKRVPHDDSERSFLVALFEAALHGFPP